MLVTTEVFDIACLNFGEFRMATEPLSTFLSIACTEIDPQNGGVGTFITGALHLADIFDRAMFVLLVGSVGGAGTVDAKLQTSISGSGGWVDWPSGAIPQITAGSKMATLEITRAQVNGAGPRPYVRLSVTVGGNAVQIAALGIGGYAVTPPASANDVAQVLERFQAP